MKEVEVEIVYPRKDSWLGELIAKLFLKGVNDSVGFVRYHFTKAESYYAAPSYIIPNHVYISYMENYSSYKQVGAALLEFIFKQSLENGAEGRIRLDAVRNTHYFYYRYGFRAEGPFQLTYYQNLSEALAQAGNKRIKT